MLAPIDGKPLVQHVWEAASRATRLDALCVATDDEGIRDAVEKFGGRAVLTSPDFASGTDRVASVALATSADIVINLQGDEPLLRPESIDALVDALESDPALEMATLAVAAPSDGALDDWNSPHVVKVAFSPNGDALYFSRAAIGGERLFKHIGIYGFRRQALERFCGLPASPLELAERLEQLRALENGMRIRVVRIEQDTIAVDVPSDIARVEAYLNRYRGKTL